MIKIFENNKKKKNYATLNTKGNKTHSDLIYLNIQFVTRLITGKTK